MAGVEKDARASVETAVRRALADCHPDSSWAASLVRLGSSWSVTLSGPGERFRHLSFVAEQHRLEEAIREATRGEADASAAGAAPAASAGKAGRGRIQDQHACPKCSQTLRVSYEGEPGEPKQLAPVACPHCWAVIHVEIGAWAVVGGDYTADKL